MAIFNFSVVATFLIATVFAKGKHSMSSSSSSSSSSSTSYSSSLSSHSRSDVCKPCNNQKMTAHNFVVVTPPVGWAHAEQVCHLNGYHLAQINCENLNEAVDMVRIADYKAVWIQSYMGHGLGKNAAVVLRPGRFDKKGKQIKPTTVKIMKALKALKCRKQYPVLCQSFKPCPETESKVYAKKAMKQIGSKSESRSSHGKKETEVKGKFDVKVEKKSPKKH